MKRSFNEKQEAIFEVLQEQMVAQGVDLKVYGEKVRELSQAFMLVEQCLWFRIETKEKVEKMITSFEALVPSILELISKHGFENLVYTYRSVNTNLYTYKVSGEKRWYKLNKKDFTSFVEKLHDGSMSIIEKPKKQAKKPSVKQGAVVSNLAMFIQGTIEDSGKAKATTKVVEKKKAAKATTKVVEKEKGKSNNVVVKGWVEHDLAKELAPKTFIKVKHVDGKNIFARYLGMKAYKKGFRVLLNDHGKDVELDPQKIEKVYTYVK